MHKSLGVLLLLLAGGTADAQERAKFAAPPPPVDAPEFMVENFVDHALKAKCAAYTMSINWKFDQKGLRVTNLEFAGVAGKAAEIAKINSWIREIPGDAVVRTECGLEGALLSFIESKGAGSFGAKQVKISWMGGKAVMVQRYNM